MSSAASTSFPNNGKEVGKGIQGSQVSGSEPDTTEDREGGEDAVLDAKIERIYRKLDLRIVPAFWVLYFLCAAIRSNVGLSLTMNSKEKHSLSDRLKLSPHEISTGLALFYVCYVLFDLPANLIMTRLSPHVWMSRIVIGVGIVGSCHAALSAEWNFYLLRVLLGIVIAGMWPGMAYYLTLFYPPSRTGKRIGQYFTAAQVSAAVVGLVSAGFQKMDGYGGLTGYEWMFLLYGLVGVIDGIAILWWLPDRPKPPGTVEQATGWRRFIPTSRPALTGEDAKIHYEDLTRVYHSKPWGVKDIINILQDWRLYPLMIMYFGVVGVGIGVQNFGTLIIRATNPTLTSVELSLLFSPIWVCDLIAILLVTPISDRFNHYRALFFSIPVCIQISGLLVTTYAGGPGNPWPRYVGLLMVGFGLGPTVPICMTWTGEIFQRRHGEVGVAAASALVSGLGNLGSVTTTYALYTGWDSDNRKGPHQFRKSNLVMIGILCTSILSAVTMGLLIKYVDGKKTPEEQGAVMDRAARREMRGQRGFRRARN
ncbi:MFS general substrate transporter [Choiromyces venosus 120613-1]|uniref:MFS general substrate transporter n=1 Tax=Choiromyces venosus 120613-1 TaxID=1336337 RepID=A0A3N4JE70_9PEZI|nr:MFS general substrate transporter [Choiromyces venosus 120613-1]